MAAPLDVEPIGTRITAMCDRILSAIGPGHSENVYRNALVIELRKNGYDMVDVERSSAIFYEGSQVGVCRSDIYARSKAMREDIVIEVKVLARDVPSTMVQARRYAGQLVEESRWLATAVFLRDGSNVELNFVRVVTDEDDDDDDVEDLSPTL